MGMLKDQLLVRHLKGTRHIHESFDLAFYLEHRHTGPVWQIAWAHPKYGHILASCSYDGKVLIWMEQPGRDLLRERGSRSKSILCIQPHCAVIWLSRLTSKLCILGAP